MDWRSGRGGRKERLRRAEGAATEGGRSGRGGRQGGANVTAIRPQAQTRKPAPLGTLTSICAQADLEVGDPRDRRCSSIPLVRPKVRARDRRPQIPRRKPQPAQAAIGESRPAIGQRPRTSPGEITEQYEPAKPCPPARPLSCSPIPLFSCSPTLGRRPPSGRQNEAKTKQERKREPAGTMAEKCQTHPTATRSSRPGGRRSQGSAPSSSPQPPSAPSVSA
jgi:hypothetical protein